MWVEGWGLLPGQLVVVSGPSGSGKSTVIRGVLRRPEVDVQLSVSATTRARRPREQEGIDYFFMPVEAFRAACAEGGFLEWAEYNGNYYGTPAAPVLQALRSNRTVLLEIEVRGALQIREKAPGAVFVFIKAPRFQVLEARLRRRGTETEQAILRRLRKAREELAEAHWYDVQLINDDLDSCIEEFVSVLKIYGRGG